MVLKDGTGMFMGTRSCPRPLARMVLPIVLRACLSVAEDHVLGQAFHVH